MKSLIDNSWSEDLKVLYLFLSKSTHTFNTLLKPGWFSIILIVSGTIDLNIGTSTVRLSTGQLFTIPGSAVRATILSEIRFCIVSCTFTFAINNRIAIFGNGYIEILTSQAYLVLSLTKAEKKHVKKLFGLLREKVFAKDAIFQFEMVLLCLSLLLYEYSTLYHKNSKNEFAIYSRREKIVMDFINSVYLHDKEHHNVKFYADLLFISKGHLRKTVREVTGMSAKYFIEMAIVSEAYLLLANNTLSVSEIAEHLNFSSLSSFSNFFKKYTKMSPNQYRLTVRH